MKLYFFFLFLASFLLVHSQSIDNDITLFGTIHEADKLLYNTTVQRPAKSRRSYMSYNFNYETFGSKNILIHAVKVLSQNGNDATVTLTNGGPGYKSVDLHFESKKGGDIFKTIEVYGS